MKRWVFRTFYTTTVLCPLLALSWVPSSFGQIEHVDANPTPIDLDRGAPGLDRCLKQLGTRASLLMITAHPDDEDGGLLAYETRGLGARAALMTLNRGEGGQNAMSNDMYDALGLLRTEELLAADRYYGVDQFWGSVIDYGFSKTREEALEKWGHDRVLGEVVRVIRTVHPLILVSVFAGAPTDGHGNHQVAGQMAQEAFVAAGDPNRFPEQIRAGLQPWSPLKVYAHVPFFQPTKEGIYDYATDKYVPVRFFDYVHQKWIEGKPATDLRIPEGTLNPAAGLTYLQIGREGLAFQRSQNHGGMIPPPELFNSEYHCYASRVKNNSCAGSVYDGIDVSLPGIAALANGDAAFLQEGLAHLESLTESLVSSYRPDSPTAIAPQLALGLKLTSDLLRQVNDSAIPEPGKDDVEWELRVKRQQFQHALSLALGIYFDALVSPEGGEKNPSPFAGPQPTFTAAVPGQTFAVEARIVNTGIEPLQVADISLDSPRNENWSVKATKASSGGIAGASQFITHFKVQVPSNAALTRPYFSRPDEEQPVYNIDDGKWRSQSFAPYPLQATARIEYRGESIVLRQYVDALHREESVGMEENPLVVAPAISVAIEPRAGAVPLQSHSFRFRCTLRSNAKSSAKGNLRLQLPAGWTATPASYPFTLEHDGDLQTVTFEIFPANIQSKPYQLKAVADYDGKTYAEGYRMVGYPGLRAYPYYRPATYSAVGVDVAVAPGLRIAFVPGTGDDVPQALQDLGLTVRTLPANEIQTANLSDFDVVILGVRAYGIRPELRAANSKLLDYVANGGTLVVQYNVQNFDRNYGPYQFSLGPNPAKVVDEGSAVEFLSANNPVLEWPNRITATDFAGWQEERGHGFMQSWDPRYAAPIETHDPDQGPQKGGLLIAHYGKGVYIYDAFALYRQLPSGVSGAFRILANLISAGKNPEWK